MVVSASAGLCTVVPHVMMIMQIPQNAIML
jgi:hypothetical protein